MKTKECPFCYNDIPEDDKTCKFCGTGFSAKKAISKHCTKHSCGSGDQSRRTEGDYEGGYVD